MPPLRQRLNFELRMNGASALAFRTVHALGGSLWIQCAMLLAVLTSSFVLPREGLPGLICWWKEVFHFDCPGCGLTRSFVAIANGQFFEAISYNPAGPLLFAGAVVALLQRVSLLSLGRELYARNREDQFFAWVLAVLCLSWAIKSLV